MDISSEELNTAMEAAIRENTARDRDVASKIAANAASNAAESALEANGGCRFSDDRRDVAKINAWLKQLETLPDLTQRIEAARVMSSGPYSDYFFRKAAGVWSDCVETLPDPVQRVEAAKIALKHANSRAIYLRSNAARMIVDNADALPDLTQRIEAAQIATRYAVRTDTKDAAIKAALQHIETLPNPVERIKGAINMAEQNGDILVRAQAVGVILRQMDNLSSFSQRLDAAAAALRYAPPGWPIQDEARSKHREVLSSPRTPHAVNHAGPDKPKAAPALS